MRMIHIGISGRVYKPHDVSFLKAEGSQENPKSSLHPFLVSKQDVKVRSEPKNWPRFS